MARTRQDPTPAPMPEPPAHLSERARGLWCEVLSTRGGTSAGRLALLQAGLEALDRADECRRVLAADGLIATTGKTGAVHIHPAAKLETEARRQFASIWRQLNLQFDPLVDGRVHH